MARETQDQWEPEALFNGLDRLPGLCNTCPGSPHWLGAVRQQWRCVLQ